VLVRRDHSTAWLFVLGAALVYLASLSVLVDESLESEPLVTALIGSSLLAGLVIRRQWVVALPLAVVAVALLWIPLADGDAILAMLGGLAAGVVLARAYEAYFGLGLARAISHDPRPHRWTPVTRVLKHVVTRDAIDGVLDRARFRIDSFPHGIYQPVESLPVRAATRGAGSESRWSRMFPIVHEQGVESAVDIGACEGYFSLKLAEAGIPTIAVEGDPRTYRTAIYAVRRSGLGNVGVLAMAVTPENVVAVPASDCSLCLSVWHHFVRYHGLDDATEMLSVIWERTGKVLFFDTGEDEMTPEYGLPAMTPEPRSWLGTYLAETCPGSRVEHLGTHRAFDPRGAPCERNLFAVIRDG
jgi:hypothetical protein